jgi:hypothetical protein
MVLANHFVLYQLKRKAVGATNTNGHFGDFPGTAITGDRRNRAYHPVKNGSQAECLPRRQYGRLQATEGGRLPQIGVHMHQSYKDRAGYILKFVRYITKNGKRIYPKSGKVFPIWVKA